MLITRRTLIGLAATAGVAPAIAQTWSQGNRKVFPRPDRSLLQPGDFVWPKKPDAFVPYDSGSQDSVQSESDRWLRERNEYLAQLHRKSTLTSTERARLALLKDMSFREFLAIYEGNQIPGIPGAYVGSGFYLGHVGIIASAEQGIPMVIEAVVNAGVRRITYDEWLSNRPEEMVWLGRLRNVPADQRAKVPAEAARYLGRPYQFWNFDLNDDAGFYCSKLVWLAVFRALHYAVDGHADPKRDFWFSPKQFLYCPTIDLVQDPSAYAY